MPTVQFIIPNAVGLCYFCKDLWKTITLRRHNVQQIARHEDASAVLQAGADIVHFDVMDNHYVANLTMGPMVCKSLRDEA